MSGAPDVRGQADRDCEEAMKTRFGENIRLLRARIHISQEELASRADIHRTQINLLESGHRKLLIATALKLAAALGVGVGTLLDGIVYRPRIFSAARGGFEISSSRSLFDLDVAGDRPEGGAGR